MYNATITRIKNVRKHSNADRLQIGTCLGEQVIVGLDTREDDLGIFFPTDGQLSDDFCRANNLYSKSAMDQLGLPYADNSKFGFFDKNRKIRTQKFRGEKSEGFWIPWNEVKGVSFTQAQEGYTFTHSDGNEICCKWETQATRNNRNNNSNRKTARGETLMFPKHYDTDQFRHKWEEIPEGSIVYLTEKLHGTSGRYGRVIDEQNSKTIIDSILNYFGYSRNKYSYLMGSRNVVLEHSSGNGFYGSDNFRYNALKNVELRKGEVIFFELVGYAETKPIMPSVKVDKKELPEIYAQYGNEIHYNYGCKLGETKLFVYRILQMNEDGQGVDLSWPQVKRRCSQLGLEHVPELKWNIDGVNTNCFHWDQPVETKALIEHLSHGPSLLDPSHIREGVAIRVETPDGKIYSLKEKSFEFKFLEGIVKSNDNYVDTEEAA